ncbi:flagellar brake protein [Acidithiobacillus sp. IBUN Pt1247-S3]|uniref:flagellar brake protein n=1 Tax=Acidithiobacillus sp. IBUN Pt1247-S3 TaxID=3166642 RepID=UPI0034E601B0
MSENLQDVRQRLFCKEFQIGTGSKALHIIARISREHLFCTLFFADRDHSYTSMLLPNANSNTLALDLPLDLPTQLSLGATVTVLVRIDGVITGFRSTLRERTQEELLIDFPDALYQMQRRQVYRVPPAIEDPDQVSITRQGAEKMLGTMQDISIGGLRALFRPAPRDFPVQAGEFFPDVRFQLRQDNELSLPATVRFSDLHSQRGDALIVGLEFAEAPTTIREIIAQYVQARDREILKALGIGLGGTRTTDTAEKTAGLGRKLRRWWQG